VRKRKGKEERDLSVKRKIPASVKIHGKENIRAEGSSEENRRGLSAEGERLGLMESPELGSKRGMGHIKKGVTGSGLRFQK